MNIKEKIKNFLDIDKKHERELKRLERENERLDKLKVVEQKRAEIHKTRAEISEAKETQKKNSAIGKIAKAISEIEVGNVDQSYNIDLPSDYFDYKPINWEVKKDDI